MLWEIWPVTDPTTDAVAGNSIDMPLASYRYPALGSHSGDPLVMLHGWGCDILCWQSLVPVRQAFADVIVVDWSGFGASASVPGFDLDAVLQRIEECLPSRCVLVGWSLGGMLAVALAERCLDRVQRVITLASNLSFVARPYWPDAMAPAVTRRINGSFQADPALAWRRFTGLMAQGDTAERDLLKRLRQAFKGGKAWHSWERR